MLAFNVCRLVARHDMYTYPKSSQLAVGLEEVGQDGGGGMLAKCMWSSAKLEQLKGSRAWLQNGKPPDPLCVGFPPPS